jgi:hypothetical protein
VPSTAASNALIPALEQVIHSQSGRLPMVGGELWTNGSVELALIVKSKEIGSKWATSVTGWFSVTVAGLFGPE